MPLVEMRDLARSVRGASSGGTGPPPHIMGMVTSVRSAVRTIHAVSPAAGAAQIQTRLDQWLQWAGDANPGRRATATAAANYIGTVEQCATWHAVSTFSFKEWEEKGVVRYSASDVVDVVIRVVLEDADDRIWGRLIFWDGPVLDVGAAEMLSSPVVDVLDSHYDADQVAGVEIWQCRTLEAHTVTAGTARGMRATVAAHVAGM